jgi:heme A synthase
MAKLLVGGTGAMTRFGRFAWGLLFYEVAVALWGTYVRATGSGAGCGKHWPLCNGEILPRSVRVETVIELSHRASSGGALLLTAILFAWALRAYPRGYPVRRGAAAAAFFMVTEAAIGAALVLFELVAHDASAKRALSVSMHLVNTFLLLASTALTAWWASGGEPIRIRGQGALGWTTGVPLAAMFLVGVSGAVTALGDTLFPSASVAAGIGHDFAADSSWFVRLRVLHPLLALATAAMIVVAAGMTRNLRPSRAVRILSRAASGLAIAQVSAGLLDVLTLAPIWVQLVHLLLAYAVWTALVLTAAAALSAHRLPPRAPAPRGLPGQEGEPADAV